MERNRRIYDELDRIVRGKIDDMPLAVIGDFNGHVGFLGSQDRNGKGE